MIEALGQEIAVTILVQVTFYSRQSRLLILLGSYKNQNVVNSIVNNKIHTFKMEKWLQQIFFSI